MKTASTLSHDDLCSALRDGTLDPDTFNHESHIRLAWVYLTRLPYEEACERFNADFLRFIVKAGAESKYHKTITDALLQLIASHLELEQCRSDWEFFKADAQPLFVNAYGLLQRFYSVKLLESDRARKEFAGPDLKAMPGPHQ
jgi:hypothetical protein